MYFVLLTQKQIYSIANSCVFCLHIYVFHSNGMQIGCLADLWYETFIIHTVVLSDSTETAELVFSIDLFWENWKKKRDCTVWMVCVERWHPFVISVHKWEMWCIIGAILHQLYLNEFNFEPPLISTVTLNHCNRNDAHISKLRGFCGKRSKQTDWITKKIWKKILWHFHFSRKSNSYLSYDQCHWRYKYSFG